MSQPERGVQLGSLGSEHPDLEMNGANADGEGIHEEFGPSILEEVVSQVSSTDQSVLAPPPDGGWRAWCVVLSSHLVYMNTWGWVNSFGIFQAYYIQRLSLPASRISWIGSISVFLLFFVGTWTGRLVDAGYFRWVFGVGIVLQVSGVMLTSVCTNYWHYFAVQGVVVGLGHSCVFCPVLAVLSTYFAKRRALAMGVAASGSATGGIVFPILVRLLLPKVGFGWTLRIMGFVQLLALTLALILAKPRIKPRRSGPLIDYSALKDVEYTLYIVACFFTCLAVYLTYYFIAAYSQIAIYPPLTFAKSLDLVVILNGVGVIGRVLANWLADYVGSINVFAPLALIASAMLYCWMAVSDTPGLYAWSVLYGIVAAAIQSLFPTGVSLLTEDLSKIGVRMGMAFTIVSFATLVGPPIAGMIIDHEGGFKGAQAFAGTAMGLGAGFLISAKRSRMKRTGAGWTGKI
ncbi:monocarboxylate transporter [Fusarium heterosporum]|uniref:Monocarboxylate transporter n=1 Tax=Fusarium heterosporum TaxID=42747 RepID=A0A8H5TY69_FUSHE|nr:monocarboxylate transporter [Fusarium heterosporum]